MEAVVKRNEELEKLLKEMESRIAVLEKKPRVHHRNSLIATLESFTGESPMFPQESGAVCTIDSESSVSEAMKMLVEKRLLSLPIVDQKKKLIGAVNLLDIVSYVLSVVPSSESFDPEWLKSRNEFSKKKIIELPQSERVISVPQKTDLYTICKLMLENSIHRIFVLDQDDWPISVITGSRLIKLCDVILDRIPKAQRSIESVGLAVERTVVSIPESYSVREGFQMILNHKVLGIAVVNEKGELTGALSVTDIRQLGSSLSFFGKLNQSIKKFLEDTRISDVYRTVPPSFDPVCVTSQHTLAHCARLISHFSIHRLFVVNLQLKPISVISVTDCLNILLSE